MRYLKTNKFNIIKIITVTFLFLSFISPVYSYENKGIVCKWFIGNLDNLYSNQHFTIDDDGQKQPAEIAHFFKKDNKVDVYHLIKSSDRISFVMQETEDILNVNENYIEWSYSTPFLYRNKLNRKILELERYFNVLEGKPLLASVRFCDVFSKSDFNLKLREVESKYQKEYDKKVEGNKI